MRIWDWSSNVFSSDLRKQWDWDKLAELAESIRAQGVIQPIVVRELPDRTFEIIAGERRWRASRLAGLAEIPAVVRLADDRTVVAMALIENIQREDLNPRSEEHTSELQSLMRISYAVFCLKKKKLSANTHSKHTTI